MKPLETPLLLNLHSSCCGFNLHLVDNVKIPTGISSLGPGSFSFLNRGEHRFQLCRHFGSW